MSEQTIRWGIVGTGMIAGQMASMIKLANRAELTAVSSRRMESANRFAGEHGVPNPYDSWAGMIASDDIDAVYVATPTSVREEICVAAAGSGKHVLGEKPFANLQSLKRITAACRDNNVGFMDGTHFVHHPRTKAIRTAMETKTGQPASIASAFQFHLADKGNIRYNPTLEPYGALGDLGWYNVRAAIEYTAPSVEISAIGAHLRRDDTNGAVVAASGLILFSDQSTTTFNCGFESGALNMELRLSGLLGEITMNDFLANLPDGSADYTWRRGGFGGGGVEEFVKVASEKPGAALMFEDFAKMTDDARLFEESVAVSEKTQAWLDAVWNQSN